MATTATRKVEPSQAAEPTTREPMITVAYDGGIHTLPDRHEAFEAFRKAGGTLVGRWAADRIAADLLSKVLSLAEVPLWVYLDDEPVAYLVRYVRRSGSRMPKVEIAGAAKRFRAS